MKTNNRTSMPLICIFVFLIVSSFIHLLYSDIAIRYLSKPANIQAIGIFLTGLGIWAMLGQPRIASTPFQCV